MGTVYGTRTTAGSKERTLATIADRISELRGLLEEAALDDAVYLVDEIADMLGPGQDSPDGTAEFCDRSDVGVAIEDWHGRCACGD